MRKKEGECVGGLVLDRLAVGSLRWAYGHFFQILINVTIEEMLLGIWREFVEEMEMAKQGEDAMKRRCAVEGGGSRRGDDDESARTQR